jgi:Holliday junction resolvase-like predicted endonuclease
MRVGLSSPHGLDVSVLLDVLHGLGADIENYSVGSGDRASYDAVVAVLAEGRATAATAFEIGHAVGRGTPVLLLQTGSVDAPLAFGTLPAVRTRVDDRETLRLHLRLFLNASAPHSDEATSAPQPVGVPWALTRLEELRRDPPPKRAQRFEYFVARLLADAGAEVEHAGDLPSGEVDMVAAIPGYERQLGVVLVEVKSGKPTYRLIDAAQRQLQEHVLASRAALGVVVYDDGQGHPEAVQVTPRIVVIGIERLLRALQQAPLSSVLMNLRDEAVHAL